MTYRWLFDRVLVRVDAERAHRAGIALLRLLGRFGPVVRALRRRALPPEGALQVETLGLRFPSPVGVAAGLDKNAEAIDGLAALGFGFVEVGTVTAHRQSGNPRPRLFRLPGDRAIVNRMGFNNDGADAVAERLRRQARRGARSDVVVGVNIGRSKTAEDALADYRHSARVLAPYADYLVVNVSSPNTPGLRDLQAVERLRPLLAAVGEEAQAAAGRRVPLLVKIAPDLADPDVLAVADLALDVGLDGIVATNTTIGRDGLVSSADEVEGAGAGGLSGAPLSARSLHVLRLLRDRVGGRLTLVSVGGVTDADDVLERLGAGATLVQAYTAFVYEGARWPARLHRALLQRRVAAA